MARTPSERVVFLVMDLVTQVRGDGFDSFFDHVARESDIQATEQALQEIGATKIVTLFRTATMTMQEVSSEHWLKALGPLDLKFYEIDEPIEELIMEYVHTHITDFS